MAMIELFFRISILLGLIIQISCVDPKFDPTTRMRLVLIPSDAPVGSVIYRLRATDEEFDYPLTFELIGDSSSSTVLIESLPCSNYNSICQANVVLHKRLEPGRYYDFQVSVKDTKGGMATQLCSITATNFTTPHNKIFPRKPGIVMIPETAKRGTELDYVIARKNPLYAKPVYLELWGSPLFGIRQKIVSPETSEGTILLFGPLDFEKQAMYHLTVLAIDSYAEPGQDTRNIAGLEIVVIVQDVQDVPPVFTIAPPVTKLQTGLLPGDKVLHVHAEDGDKGNPRDIRYGLVSEGNPFTSFFRINDTTGDVFLMRPLDDISAIIHVGDPVILTVIAEEVKVTRDEPPAMATTVQLAFFLPERSNSPPYFENDHYISRVDENAPQGTALKFADPYIPQVYDDDTGKNGVFSLTLLNNNGTFEISPNVAERSASFLIRVRDGQYLDYEERQSVIFQVLAQELGPSTNLSATVNVTVYINDVNDNPPVFTQTVYTVELPENMTVGSKVVQVHAEDIDTGMGGRIRYTQILGYLNTSLNLNPADGTITVSKDNHGFDRETMPEYHLYVEARDNDGTGNSAQVPLVIKIIDVNDEAPIFEKSVYEFILSPDFRNFTSPAYLKAIDKDATAPNNEVRYEIVHGNYENKFNLDKITGELTVAEQFFKSRKNSRRRRQIPQDKSGSESETNFFVLTARAYDLGVPVQYSTTTVRIYPPESRARTFTFVVPGHSPDKAKTEETLSALTGGQVIIHNIRPLGDDEPAAKNLGGDIKERSVVTATVLYDGNSVVDVSQIQRKLSQHNTSLAVMTQEEQHETVYKAENKLLFWLLILLAILIAITILILLFCCICSWCPLYGATSKRVINVNNTEDDVHLVHREKANGKQTKSVQVAEWMGRREAWSAEKSADSRTKPTRWEFSRRVNYNQKLEHENRSDNREDGRRVRSADDRRIKIRNQIKDTNTTRGAHFHNSRTNLINDRDIYIEDVDENVGRVYAGQYRLKNIDDDRHIDDDSMRRHEIDRGSDLGYTRSSLKRHTGQSGNRELFIKDGNAEILQLMTRSKQEDDNIYANIPPKVTRATTLTQPHVIMVDNSGKEILLRRFIEEQPDGKQIIREHYQIVPGPTYIQTMPNEVQTMHSVPDLYVNKSGAGSMGYSATEAEVKTYQPVQTSMKSEIDTQIQAGPSNQPQIQSELENSLKQQNALLRQILLEKEKLEERYSQTDIALETQSLPCHSMAIATQTDCEAGTQTDSPKTSSARRRRARSENDDSMSEDEYEYVRYSPPNSPDEVCWVKRKRQKRKPKYRPADKPRKRVVMVEDVKRKIRTPIKEETEETLEYSRRTPTKHKEPKPSMLKRIKSDGIHRQKKLTKSPPLNKDVLMEISDSLEEQVSPDNRERKKHRIRVKEIEYYQDSDGETDCDEIVIRRNNYSAETLNTYSDAESQQYSEIAIQESRKKTYAHQKTRTEMEKKPTTKSVPATPTGYPRLSRKDSKNKKEVHVRRQTTSEPPTRMTKRLAPKPPTNEVKKSKRPYADKAQSETDLVNQIGDDDETLDSSKSGSVPRYMEWYYGKKKGGDDKTKQGDQKFEKQTKKSVTRKPVGAIDKRSNARLTKQSDRSDDSKYKPEPMPRKSPPKTTRLLKEDILVNKTLKPRIEVDSNHPLLQYSEHRFEHEYNPAPDIPIPPTKLPHYMYPETPPFAAGEGKKSAKEYKPMPSPIKEDEVKTTKIRLVTNNETLPNQSKQLNVSTLEDDHDSGIAMNSLLNSMGRRNPIAEKKSVFTIAYDDVSRVKKIQSESESPQFS